MTTTKTAPLTLERSAAAVEALSDYYQEPAWMREARREAWQHYEALPWPTRKEEAWRRLPLEQYPLDEQPLIIAPTPAKSQYDLPACWLSPMAPEAHASGMLLNQNGAVVHAAVNPKVAAQGVILTDLHQALQTHSDLIRRRWLQGSIARADFNKFTALNAALWQGGTFVYVPENVQLTLPLQITVGYDEHGGTGLHHTLVIAEKGARVTLLHDRRSKEKEPTLNAEIVEIYADESAWVRYASFQHWGNQRHTVSVQNAQLARDAHLLWTNGELGGRMTKDFLRTDLLEPGANGVMQGFNFANAQQHIDQSTYQHHRAPDTYSNLLFRNVLRDQAKTVFYGMIRVEPEAQRTQGYQANNNLLLDNAHAHSIPGLEIIANDVKCSHGSTVSRIDREQLYYLQSRAISLEEAEQLIVQGFLNPIIDRIPLACTRDQLKEELAWRFRRA